MTDSYFGTFISAESDKGERQEMEGNNMLVIIQCRKEVFKLSWMWT